jgi:hypothetical protein
MKFDIRKFDLWLMELPSISQEDRELIIETLDDYLKKHRKIWFEEKK